MTTRDTLKTYFRKGAIPKASEFVELIDQVLIQNDDNLFQAANGPLGIKATAEGSLLNFYDKDNQLTWQLKQQEDKAVGLSLRSGEQSRLFINSATGNIGIGTTETGKAKLTVAGDTRLNGKVDVTGATTFNDALTVKGATTTTTLEGPLTVAGLLTASKGANIAAGMMIVSADGKVGIGVDPTESLLHIKGSGGRTKGIHLSSTGTNSPAITVFPGTNTPDAGLITFGDGTGWKFHIGLGWDSGKTKFLTVQDDGRVGIGITDPGVKLHVVGDAKVDGGLQVNNNIKVDGGLQVNNNINVAGNANVDGNLKVNNGITFGKGRSQNSAVEIKSGTVTIQAPGVTLVPLNFGLTKPTVIASLSGIQASLKSPLSMTRDNLDLGIDITVSDIAGTSFKINATSSSDTTIKNLTVNWIAFLS